MDTVDNSVIAWLLKYIIPVIIIPILTSAIISYGAVKSISTQQINNGKRIDQIQLSTDTNRLELSNHNKKLSRIEVIIENINDHLDDSIVELRKIRSDVSDIGEIVIVLKDRAERGDSGGKL